MHIVSFSDTALIRARGYETGALVTIYEGQWERAISNNDGIVSIYTPREPKGFVVRSNTYSFPIKIEKGEVILNGEVILSKRDEPWSWEYHKFGMLIGFNYRICLLRIRE